MAKKIESKEGPSPAIAAADKKKIETVADRRRRALLGVPDKKTP